MKPLALLRRSWARRVTREEQLRIDAHIDELFRLLMTTPTHRLSRR